MKETWNLDEIYVGFDAPAFLNDFDALGVSVSTANALSENLKNVDDVKKLISEWEKYVSLANRIDNFAHYIYSTNTSDADAVKYLYKLEEKRTEAARVTVRLAMFLKNYEFELIKNVALDKYDFWLRFMAEKSRHMMSEDEEALASGMMASGSSAWDMLQSKLISTLTCEYDNRVINISDCRNLAYDKDAAVRKAAYEAELNAYVKVNEPIAAALNSIKAEVNVLSRQRKFETPLSQQLFMNGMTLQTLDAMFASIDHDIHFFRDYLKAKAKYLSQKLNKPYNGLPFYDLFAPVGAQSDKPFSYEEVKQLVMDNFKKFSPKMAAVAQMAFDKNWIDVYPKEGKVSGAYCGHIHAIKQFRILLNFGGSLSDAITLAHELGHGYHAMMIMDESILNADYPMPLAETASTFCENIVNNACLDMLQGEEKLNMLENSLQDSTQVIIDIYSRFLFEKAVFETRLDHPLSVEELNNLMLDAQRKAYGDGLDPAYLHPSMWVVKPHYYSGQTSFYNFPYAFGHLLANGIYAMYEADPASFGKRYDEFLRNTGKMYVKDVCALLDIDVEDVLFWKKAMNVLKERVAEFIKLVGK